MALEVTGVGNNTKILQQNKGVEQTEKDIQLFEGCGTGHSDNLDIKRNDYQKKLNEVEKAKIALKGFAPAFETNEDGDIVVKTPGDGTLYVTALENKIKELDKNLKKAEEKSTKLKNELNRYQNTPEFLNRTDDTTYEKKDKEFRDAVDAAEKIKKNIET